MPSSICCPSARRRCSRPGSRRTRGWRSSPVIVPVPTPTAPGGAPGATQVADRWHILVNLREALERLLARKHAAVRAAADDVLSVPSPAPPTVDGPTLPEPAAADRATRAPTRPAGAPRPALPAIRGGAALFTSKASVSIRLRGRSGSAQHGPTLPAGEGFPERQPRRPGRTLLTPYEPYLRERWDAGCRNIAVLWREVRTRGYAGSYSGLTPKWSAGATITSQRTAPHRHSCVDFRCDR